MRYTYFAVKTGVPATDVVVKHYGAFDESDHDPKNVEKARAAYEEKLSTGPLFNPVIGPIVAIGYLGADGATASMSAEVGDFDSEAKVLHDFWQRYNRSGGLMAGWDIHAGDLHTIKVRSWLHKIPIPARAMRAAGTNRINWIGFTDVMCEFNGRPGETDAQKAAKLLGVESENEEKPDYLDKVAKFFNLHGRQSTRESFWEDWQSGDSALRQRAIDGMHADLAQIAAVAVRIGLENQPAGPVLEFGVSEPMSVGAEEVGERAEPSAVRKPTHFDIETAPGELAKIKAIMGEFDPKRVKTGNLKDPVKIAQKIEDARKSYDQDLLKLSMLDPLLGRISAIGYKHPDKRVDIPRMGEREMLEYFWKTKEKSPGDMTGWNIFGFDLWWIVVRSWHHGIMVPANALSRAGNGYAKPRGFTDLMVEFVGNNKEYLKIDKAAKFFGHPGKNGEGAEFFKLWESEDPAEQQEGFGYLRNDVDMSEFVADGMGLGGIDVNSPAANAPDVEELLRRMSALAVENGEGLEVDAVV